MPLAPGKYSARREHALDHHRSGPLHIEDWAS